GRILVLNYLFTPKTQLLDAWLSGNTEIQVADRDQGQTENNTEQDVSNRWATWENGVVNLTLKDTSEVQKAFDEYTKRPASGFNLGRKETLTLWSAGCQVWERLSQHENDGSSTWPYNLSWSRASASRSRPVFKLFKLQLKSTQSGKYETSHELVRLHKSTTFQVWYMREGMPIQKWIDPKWTKYIRCGPDASPGLSVLDVDNINYLYNCQGCQRHRWIPAASLSHEDFSNMPTFGYESENKNPIFACRAQHQAEIVSGMYDHASKTCKLSWANKPYKISDTFEILTIPGGVVGNDCSVYKPPYGTGRPTLRMPE
ncbi:hypothetical protein Ocin01_19016, partial [Orchesella cincta]